MKLKVNGKEYQCLFSSYLLGELQFIYKVGIDEVIGVSRNIEDKDGNVIDTEIIVEGLLNTYPFKYTPEFIYHSIRLGCELDEKPFDVTKKDIIDFLDSEGGIAGDFAINFVEKLIESVYGKENEVPEEKSTGNSKKK